jgi:hypothetical protein
MQRAVLDLTNIVRSALNVFRDPMSVKRAEKQCSQDEKIQCCLNEGRTSLS